MTESDLEKLNGVTHGSVSSNKVLVADENNDLSGLSTVNLTVQVMVSLYLKLVWFNNENLFMRITNAYLVVKSSHLCIAKIQLISDAADEAGDGVEIKTLNGNINFS